LEVKQEGRPIRLFGFGQEKARQRVRQALKDWDDRLDWFVS